MACFGTKEGKEQLHAKAVALRRYPGWISLTHARNAERKRLTKVHRPRVFIRFKRCDPLGSHIAKPDLGDNSDERIAPQVLGRRSVPLPCIRTPSRMDNFQQLSPFQMIVPRKSASCRGDFHVFPPVPFLPVPAERFGVVLSRENEAASEWSADSSFTTSVAHCSTNS